MSANLAASLPPPLDLGALAAALDACGGMTRRFDVDVLAECTSTNSLLTARAEAGAPSGTVIVAERQTAGRGRRGRTWLSAPGDSLTFSLLWRFPPTTRPDGLSLAVGVALARALESLGVAGVALKWPNDLLLDGRKLAGILIELAPGNRPTPSLAAVIGIGLNLRLPPDLPSDIRAQSAALSQNRAAVQPVDPNRVLAAVLAALHGQLQDFSRQGFAGARAEWQQRHAHEGRAVRILGEGTATLDGLCRGVDADGALLLQTPGGLQRIVSGEVSLRSA